MFRGTGTVYSRGDVVAMKVAVGCDHAGFRLKPDVLGVLEDLKVEQEDFGCFSEEPQDYPDIAAKVAGAVASGKYDRGILICGTGIGMSMAANKAPPSCNLHLS